MSSIKGELKRRYFGEEGEPLTDREKLHLLLSYSERGGKAAKAADRIASAYGDLRSAADSDPAFLMRECGISRSSAALLSLIPQISRKCAIISCGSIRLSSADAAKRYFSAYLRSCRTETVAAAAADERFRIISACCIDSGEKSQVRLSVRKIAEFAFSHDAKYVFIAHNHITGLAKPSENDISATLKLRAALETLDIVLADHIITASDLSAVSMRQECPDGCFVPIRGYSVTTDE